ncbi:MAG: FG-GAP repeat protein, partial [Bacteroidales bacterium]|nr:FG-GAP repeat protein [Bacteroidales bacterium]
MKKIHILQLCIATAFLLFTCNGLIHAQNWAQLGIDINGVADNDQSGRSVSLSADGLRVAIGAPYYGTDRGQVRIFEDIAGTWTPVKVFDGVADSDQFGSSVSLSADGLRVAIGAPLNEGGGTNRGQVRIFKDIAGTWTPVEVFDGVADGDQFGRSVSLNEDGTIVAIGAPFAGTNHGQVSIFKDIAGTWTPVEVFDGVADGDQFGRSVSL